MWCSSTSMGACYVTSRLPESATCLHYAERWSRGMEECFSQIRCKTRSSSSQTVLSSGERAGAGTGGCLELCVAHPLLHSKILSRTLVSYTVSWFRVLGFRNNNVLFILSVLAAHSCHLPKRLQLFQRSPQLRNCLHGAGLWACL